MKNVHVDSTLTEEGAAADAKAVGEALAKKADTKGTYEDLIVGGAEQLMADGYETDKDPYLFRPTGGSADVGNREYMDKIVGGTVAWNQLCNGSSVTVQSGRKYLLKKGTTWSIGASTGTAITGLTSGSDMLIDLTAIFGSTIADYIYSLEQSQAGAGVAWFRQYFPKDYYPYDPGTLRSVEGVSAHETVGKNLLDTSGMSTARQSQATFARTADGVITVGGKAVAKVYRVIETFQTIKDVQYTITGTPSGGASGKYRMTVGGYGYDYGDGYTFTGDGEAHAISIDVYTGYPQSGTLTFRPMIRFASVSDSTFEPYQKHTYPLDSSLTLRGVPKLVDGKLSFDGDVYPPSGEVQRRYGLRAYQSGDESLADAITDGANTVYKLATPTTETAEGYEQYQICDPSGTEEFVTDSIVPVGHETRYPHDLKKKIETAPDSPSTDGTYLMKRSGGKNTYMALPSTPSANGAYVLTVTVSGGTASYSWTAKE